MSSRRRSGPALGRNAQIPAAPQIRGKTPGSLSSPSGSDTISITARRLKINQFGLKGRSRGRGGRPAWRNGHLPQPPNRARRGEQATARRLNLGVNTSAGRDRTPHHASQNPTVVEVTMHTAAVQYEHSHGRVKHSQQFDETALTSRFFVSTAPVGRSDRGPRNREARHRCQYLATPSVAFRREVQTLTTIWQHRAKGAGDRAEIACRNLDHRQSVPTVGPDALVDESVRHRHLVTSSPAAAAAASACWPGIT